MDDTTTAMLSIGSAFLGAIIGAILTYIVTFRVAKWQFCETVDFERIQFGKTMEFERQQEDDRREQQRKLEKEQSDLLFSDVVREIKDNHTILERIKKILDYPSLTYDNWLTIHELAEDLSFINFESYIGTGLQRYQTEICKEITQNLYRRMLEVSNRVKYASEHFTAYSGISNADYLRSVLRKEVIDLVVQAIKENDEVLKKIEPKDNHA